MDGTLNSRAEIATCCGRPQFAGFECAATVKRHCFVTVGLSASLRLILKKHLIPSIFLKFNLNSIGAQKPAGAQCPRIEANELHPPAKRSYTIGVPMGIQMQANMVHQT